LGRDGGRAAGSAERENCRDGRGNLGIAIHKKDSCEKLIC
jgi:hypothetical protein